MSRRDCTFLPSQNHGHGAAKAARPMAALPHPCTNFAAASVHGAECCRSGGLKEHKTRQRVERFYSRLEKEGASYHELSSFLIVQQRPVTVSAALCSFALRHIP